MTGETGQSTAATTPTAAHRGRPRRLARLARAHRPRLRPGRRGAGDHHRYGGVRQLHRLAGRAFLPILLTLMIVKFFSVVLFFMHLRFDSKIFSVLFYAGLFLAVGVYTVALFTFHFFDVYGGGVGARPVVPHRRSVPIRLASRGLGARRVPDRCLRVHGAGHRPARGAGRPATGEPSTVVLLRRRDA